jgi:hypothetical protein
MKFRDKLDPEYDPRPYEQIPKLRGVFVSLVIALLVWVFMAHLLSLALALVAYLYVFILDGHVQHITQRELFSGYVALILFSLFVEFVSHGTAFVCFFACRTYPSLVRAILFSMIGRRYHNGSMGGSGRINRINILGC